MMLVMMIMITYHKQPVGLVGWLVYWLDPKLVLGSAGLGCHHLCIFIWGFIIFWWRNWLIIGIQGGIGCHHLFIITWESCSVKRQTRRVGWANCSDPYLRPGHCCIRIVSFDITRVALKHHQFLDHGELRASKDDKHPPAFPFDHHTSIIMIFFGNSIQVSLPLSVGQGPRFTWLLLMLLLMLMMMMLMMLLISSLTPGLVGSASGG